MCVVFVIIILVCDCRFYFVGDEDLLEIIGNSKSVPKLQKHFKKMFAGIASVVLSEDGTQVLGISSREGEQVCVCVCVWRGGGSCESERDGLS